MTTDFGFSKRIVCENAFNAAEYAQMQTKQTNFGLIWGP